MAEADLAGRHPLAPSEFLAVKEIEPVAENNIEISARGKWIKVCALNAFGKTIIVKGNLVKVAAIHDEAWMETELENPEIFVQKLKKQGSHRFRANIFSFSQKVPATIPKYSYHIEWDSVAVARTSSFKEWWEKLPQETRKNVRRSHKRSVVVEVREFNDILVKQIIELNNDTPMRGGRPNVQCGKSFDEIKKDHSAFLDRSDFVCAFFGDELIGFLKMVYRGDVASILNLLSKEGHCDKRPANALIAKAVEICEAKGLSYLTYGMFNYGNKRDSPLREFKIRNGFEEMLMPRFYIPLTKWGRLAMKLKLHRGLLGILPHRAIAMALRMRAKWYNFTRSATKPV